MAGETREIHTEQEHQEAVETSEKREEKVHEAIGKIVSTIDELTDAPSPLSPSVAEFETTLPMHSHDSKR